MKIAELRNIAKDLDQETTAKLLAECYKALPKAKKEEFDPFLNNPTLLLQPRQKIIETVDYDSLFSEIDGFVSDARCGFYFAPNHFVPKGLRARWRKNVGRYIKDLSAVEPESPIYKEAVLHLFDVYKVLCQGCDEYLFSSNDTFASLRIEQDSLFERIVHGMLCVDCTEEKFRDLITAACCSGLSFNSLHIQMYTILAVDSIRFHKDAVIYQLTKDLIEETEEKYRAAKQKNRYPDSSRKYFFTNRIQEYLDFAVCLNLKTDYLEEARNFFWLHSTEPDRSTALDSLLRSFEYFSTNEEWLNTYNDGIMKRKIKVTGYLENQHQTHLNLVQK